MYGWIEIEAKYIKEEIDIRIESMRIQLDELKIELEAEVDNKQKELKGYINRWI